jgi:hypothetical protein
VIATYVSISFLQGYVRMGVEGLHMKPVLDPHPPLFRVILQENYQIVSQTDIEIESIQTYVVEMLRNCYT